MKNKFLTTKYFLLSLLIFAGILSSCKKDNELAAPPRIFRPVFTLIGTTSNNIVAKWTNITAATSFTVALSTDSFKTIYKSVVTDSAGYTFENVDWDREYQIRVRSNGKDSASSSGYFLFGGIPVAFPTLLSNLASSDVTDVGVRPLWASNRGNYTSLKIFKMPKDSLVTEVSLTAQDTINKYKEVYGLQPNTSYQVVAYSGSDYKGRKLFRTAAAQIFSIPVDLRGMDDATAKTTLTTAYLQTLLDGSTIILKRGMTYTISSTVSIEKSVTFTTGLGFGTNLAVFDMTGGNFSIAASANVGQVCFKDVNLLGNQASYGIPSGGRYLFNINGGSTIGKIILDNCKIRELRAVIRVQSLVSTIDTIRINNCQIDSIRDYGVVHCAVTNAKVKNIMVTNSTISNALKLFTNATSDGTESIYLSDNTFCYVPNGGASFMDYTGRSISNGVTIKNCIFGPGIALTTTPLDSVNGYSGTATFTTTGSYKTSDLKFRQKAGLNPLPDLNSYSGSASTLFKQPDQGDFTIKDLTFAGKSNAGDPRWRP